MKILLSVSKCFFQQKITDFDKNIHLFEHFQNVRKGEYFCRTVIFCRKKLFHIKNYFFNILEINYATLSPNMKV